MEMQRRRDLVAVEGLIVTAWTGENGDIPVAFNEKSNTIPVGLSLIHIFTSNGTNQLALPPPKSSSLLAAK